MSLRSLLYGTARVLNDVNAVKRKKVSQRLANKAIGRLIVSKLWRR